MTSSSPLIGILGGMGPQAGLDMADKIIALTRTECDQDHLPFVLLSFPATVPDRSAFLLGETETNPAYAIADQFETMAKLGVSVAVMACNTAHASPIFDVAVELLRKKGVNLRILHLVNETVSYIRERHVAARRIGILGTRGTYQARLYDRAVEAAGLEVILPDKNVRENNVHAALYSPIFGIKTHPDGVRKEARMHIEKAIAHVRSRGAEAIILGCTELPLAIKADQIDGVPILDPARVMAEKLIRVTYPDRLA